MTRLILKIVRIGSARGIIIPKDVADALKLDTGKRVEITIDGVIEKWT